MEPKTKDLWVFVETKADGSAKNVGIELLSPGRMIADKQGGKLVALIVGCHVEEAVKEADEHGADFIICVDGPEFARYTTDAYTDAVAAMVQKYAPTSMLIGATANGRDFAPRVACRLHSGLTADCTGLDIDEETGDVVWTRPAFGGNLMAMIVCPDHRPQFGTVRPGVFKKPAIVEKHAEIIEEPYPVSEESIRTKVLDLIRNMDEDSVDLEAADVIVAGGYGVGGPEGFKLIKELADLLGGVVGSSRVPVDLGWISHNHQLGQTGKTASPKLYIACGISGAIQHVAGINGSDCIVAINNDPDAPIFEIANYGIVGNLTEVIPLFIEEYKKRKTI